MADRTNLSPFPASSGSFERDARTRGGQDHGLRQGPSVSPTPFFSSSTCIEVAIHQRVSGVTNLYAHQIIPKLVTPPFSPAGSMSTFLTGDAFRVRKPPRQYLQFSGPTDSTHGMTPPSFDRLTPASRKLIATVLFCMGGWRIPLLQDPLRYQDMAPTPQNSRASTLSPLLSFQLLFMLTNPSWIHRHATLEEVPLRYLTLGQLTLARTLLMPPVFHPQHMIRSHSPNNGPGGHWNPPSALIR
jgi:hypothetical protein